MSGFPVPNVRWNYWAWRGSGPGFGRINRGRPFLITALRFQRTFNRRAAPWTPRCRAVLAQPEHPTRPRKEVETCGHRHHPRHQRQAGRRRAQPRGGRHARVGARLRRAVRASCRPRGLVCASLIVLDTHALVWVADGSDRLGAAAREEVEGAARAGGIGISAITCWEIALLAEKGPVAAGMRSHGLA